MGARSPLEEERAMVSVVRCRYQMWQCCGCVRSIAIMVAQPLLNRVEWNRFERVVQSFFVVGFWPSSDVAGPSVLRRRRNVWLVKAELRGVFCSPKAPRFKPYHFVCTCLSAGLLSPLFFKSAHVVVVAAAEASLVEVAQVLGPKLDIPESQGHQQVACGNCLNHSA
jgi:hypothetical protein